MQSAIFRFIQLFATLVLSVWLIPAQAQVSADVSSIAFGKVVVGGSAMQSVAVQTGGATDIGGEISGTGFSLAGGCSPYGNCIFYVTFSPTSSGSASGQLTIKNTASGATLLTIPLSGESGYPSFSLSVASIDFGAHSLTTPAVYGAPLVITNTGEYAVSLNVSSSAVGSNFAGASGCWSPISVGQSCSVTMYFYANATGPQSGYYYFAAQGLPPFVVPYSGYGVPAPNLSVTSSTVNFAEQAFGVSSSVQYMNLVNNGGGDLTLTSVTPDLFDYEVTYNSCATVIPAGNGCTIGWVFTPYRAGSRPGAIQILHSAPNGAVNVALTGTGATGLVWGNSETIERQHGQSGEHCSPGMPDYPECTLTQDQRDMCAIDPSQSFCSVLPNYTPPPSPPPSTPTQSMLPFVQTSNGPPRGWVPLVNEDRLPGGDGSGSTGSPCEGGPATPQPITNPSMPDELQIVTPSTQKELDDIGVNVPPTSALLTGDPIHAALGDKSHHQTDYGSADAFGIWFLRAYNGLADISSAYAKQYLGPGWTSSWDISVNLNANSTIARLTRGNGASFAFTKQPNGTWLSATNIPATLTQTLSGANTTGWQFTMQNRVENYNATGRLISRVLADGKTYTLTYSGTPSRLYQVTSPLAKTLTFTYDAKGRLSTMVNPAGGIHTYTYDSKHRLIAVKYPDNRIRQYKYEHATYKFALTSIINEAGQTYVSFTYDAQGRATSTKFNLDGVNQTGVGTITYNANGSSTAQDASGATVTRSFVQAQGLILPSTVQYTCAGCGNVSDTYNYDTTGRLSNTINRNGVATAYTYTTDGRNLIASVTEANGTSLMRTTSTTWHPTFSVPTQIVAPTKTTNFTYNAAGKMLTRSEVADGQTRTTTYTYNAQGMLATVTGPRTDVADTTTYTYNAQGQISSVTNPKGQTVSYTSYDAHGNVLAVTYANGTTGSFTYDARSRPLTRTIAGQTTSTTYNANGQEETITDPQGQVTTFLYDNVKRLTGKNLSNGEKLRYTLDNAGRTIQTQTFDAQNNLASTESATYDGLNRITQRINAQNKITVYTYDANGNVTAVTDPNNLTTTTQYDALNRPILITDPLGKTVATTYNSQNLITSVRDPNNNTTTYTYSGFGDNLQTQSPDTGLTTATYNAGSLPITKTDARGKTSSYTYDVLGRIITVAYNDTTTGTTMTYDIATNGVGQLASVSDPSGTSTYTYDAYSRMISKTTTVNAINGAPSQTKTISYTRDSTGKVTSMTYPSGKVLALSYVQGRTNAMTLNAVPLISGIQYFPFGGPESWLLGSSTSTKEYTRIIDQSSRTQQYTTPSGFRTIQYDNASRIVGINNYTGTTQAAALANGITASQLFTYDNAGRLTTFSGYTSNGVNATTGLGNAPITQTQSFAYDNNGNRTSSTLNSIASTYSYQSGNNRLASVAGGIIKTNSYDATGNLTTDGAQTYTYDARGRLTGATVPANATAPTTNYLINYQGLRVKKANANTATTNINRTFIYDDGGKMLGEYDHAGNAVQELIWLGDTPIAVTGTMPCLTSTTGANGIPTCTEAATAYIFTDHLNTPREVARINTTTNAYVSLWKWDSLPFGETQANENPSSTGIFSFNHRFPGQYKDKETGLNQNWFRDYDAAVGRYIEVDPIGLKDGPNPFTYVGSNPVQRFDPLGLSMCDIAAAFATLADNSKLKAAAGGWKVDIPTGQGLGYYDKYNKVIHLSNVFLGDLSNQWLAELFDTVIHETGHANNWITSKDHDNPNVPNSDPNYDKGVTCIRKDLSQRFAEMRWFMSCGG